MAGREKIVARIHINGSIEDVWREITKLDEPQGSFFNMRCHTDGYEPGGQIRMRTPNGKWTGVVGEVLEFDPPRRYSHTLRFTRFDDPPCIVTYELEEVGGGVEFTLTVHDVMPGTSTAKQLKGGAGMIVRNLKAIVETGKPPIGTRMLYRLFGIMEAFAPKSTRSENWPLPSEEKLK